MAQMGTTGARISTTYPEQDLRLVKAEWDHRDVIAALCDWIRNTFPLKMDMGKISACKQRDNEAVTDYLIRLAAVHTTHSGLVRPPVLGGVHEFPLWEAQLQIVL